MKKIETNSIFLAFFFIIAINTVLPAQTMKRNLIQLKYKVHYFKNSELEFIQNLPYPIIAYSRFSKDGKYFIGGEIDRVAIVYEGDFSGKDRGFVLQRNFINFEIKGGYQLFFTPKISLLSKLGISFRTGYESQILFVVTTGWNEIVTRSYSYNNPGIEASAESIYHLNNRWSLCLGGGYQYFLSRAATNHHLRMNAGLGYSF